MRLAFILAAVCLAAASASAESLEHRTRFDVYFGIIPVGEADFRISVTDKSYDLRLRGRTTGVVDLVAPGRGDASSSGTIGESRMMARTHSVKYVDLRKDKTSELEMEFSDEDVPTVRHSPEKRARRGRNWVPIAEEDLRDVIDPASAILIPGARASGGRSICDRKLPVYDGETRFDIVLRYKHSRQIETDGYKGAAYVCQLRYIPVSGHKKGRKNVEYMAANEGIEIWLAPIGDGSLYAPIRIEAPSWIGTFTATARYFGPARQRSAHADDE